MAKIYSDESGNIVTFYNNIYDEVRYETAVLPEEFEYELYFDEQTNADLVADITERTTDFTYTTGDGLLDGVTPVTPNADGAYYLRYYAALDAIADLRNAETLTQQQTEDALWLLADIAIRSNQLVLRPA